MPLSQLGSLLTLNPDVLPLCAACGGILMRLVGIEPDKPSHERRTFECAKCASSETFLVKFN